MRQSFCSKLLIFIFLLLPVCVHAQDKTVVKGKVLEAANKQPLPYASVVFKRGNTSFENTTTNDKGEFRLESTRAVDSIHVYYMGYITEKIRIRRGKSQEVTVRMKDAAQRMSEVVVSAEKTKYTKKNNPAVAIIEKTIARKSKNRMENQDYYQFKEHEKMEFSISNVGDSAKNTRMLRKVNFIFDNVDTSSLTGKRYLPVYFSEIISENYFRKNPKASKKYIDAQKNVEISKFLDDQTMDVLMREMFGDIDIYENNVYFLSNQFMSPLAPLSPDFYKFWISDTTDVSGTECFKLGFTPRNPSDFGFMGNLYITTDSTFAVKRAELQVTSNTQVNYVNDILVEHEYEKLDSVWVLRKDLTLVDFSLIGKSTFPFYGRKENLYTNYQFNVPQPDNLYKGAASVIRTKGFDKRSEEYWDTTRVENLRRSESGIYAMFKRLDSVWVYRFVRNVTMSLVGGYFEAGPIDVGPVGNVISWNSIEGARFRLGGKTNGNMSKHLFLEGYLAYGLKDEKFKYSASAHYSFNEKKNTPWEFPQNFLSVKYEYDTYIPGESYLYGSGDRLFISIGRGETERMTLERLFETSYKKENIHNFFYDVKFRHLEQYPLGTLTFETGNGYRYDPYTTTSVGVAFRFAPNEKYVQAQKHRYPVNATTPVFTLDYQYGIPDFWNSDYGFHKLSASFAKRWYISSFGYVDVATSAGIIFNQVPYPSLFVHQANQSFAFQTEAYNSMRYLEFVSDRYADIQLQYCFNGFIFNRIPLIKKLKWRECIAFKALFGSVSDKNDPAKNPDLMRFPYDVNGNPTTFSLNDGPFMEANLGIDNIFTILRLDLVKRLSYFNNPDIQEWSVRATLRFTF